MVSFLLMVPQNIHIYMNKSFFSNQNRLVILNWTIYVYFFNNDLLRNKVTT